MRRKSRLYLLQSHYMSVYISFKKSNANSVSGLISDCLGRESFQNYFRLQGAFFCLKTCPLNSICSSAVQIFFQGFQFFFAAPYVEAFKKANHLMMKFLKSLLFQVKKSSRFSNLQYFLVRGNLEHYQILKIFRPEITKILKTSSLDGQLWRRLHRMSPSLASSITGAFAVVSAVRGGFVALLFFRNFSQRRPKFAQRRCS